MLGLDGERESGKEAQFDVKKMSELQGAENEITRFYLVVLRRRPSNLHGM